MDRRRGRWNDAPASLEHGVERGRELSGSTADEAAEPISAPVEVHDEVASLLRRPGTIRVLRHAEDVEAAVVDLDHEQDVEPPQHYRAVDVEEVGGQRAGGRDRARTSSIGGRPGRFE